MQSHSKITKNILLNVYILIFFGGYYFECTPTSKNLALIALLTRRFPNPAMTPPKINSAFATDYNARILIIYVLCFFFFVDEIANRSQLINNNFCLFVITNDPNVTNHENYTY